MKVVTLTINPALDKSAQVEEMTPFDKLECNNITYHPGGGGINISRVLHRLGIESNCLFPYGGKTGEHLVELLQEQNISVLATPISILTRENFAVFDIKTGLQFRFGMPTEPFLEKEMTQIEELINKSVTTNDILVISGSLPKGLPVNYYSKIIKNLNSKGVKVVVDTSGPVFNEVLENELYLIKPNQKELARLAGKESQTKEEQEAFALKMVTDKIAKYVVVSLGKDGAFIAHKNGIDYIAAPKITVKSTIGAGDSMVAGLIYGTVKGKDAKEMLRWGVACGVSATLSEGSDLAHIKNIEKVLKLI
ncbi:1-phosphofructokinase family hexose kinase [Polaribacter sargassicola]|uniref:1-phosphofructokinase family hexose kinase n=1 Tax=Polaribacter sargassicola TaxID=2836891 RepID=UPI001F1A8CD1|nr:1-phosphofructokinase family hexose kinase [Polaribacter sp. DS7-9]MCG1037064.1 1-phosphofructokinase family hexose kinase [Polaribacter sp. DS7-9]